MTFPTFLTVSAALFFHGLTHQERLGGKLEKLQGTWVLVQTSDEKHTDRGDCSIRMHIEGNRVSMTFLGLTTNQGPLTLDPHGKGQIDIELACGQTVKGRYEVCGDTLALCFDESGRDRPEGLKPRNSQWAEKWKRVAKGRRAESRR